MVNKNENYKISYLEQNLYKAANTFHGGGDLSNLEILNVAIPTIFLKRVLDLRQDYIEKELMEVPEYNFDSPVNALKVVNNDINQVFRVINQDEWFFVTYQDILDYQDNDKEEEIEIKLTIDKNIKLKTNARNRVAFIKELQNNLNHKIIDDIFKRSRYFSLYLEDKLTDKECKILFNKFANFYFGRNVSTDIFSQAYIYLISRFAESAGQKGGEFFTPDPICKLVVACLQPELKNYGVVNVADLTSGSATFLIEFGQYIANKYSKENAVSKIEFFLQEVKSPSLILGEAGLLLAGFQYINSYHGNTLLNYNENIGKHRKKMDYVIGNPPYGQQVMEDEDYIEVKKLMNEEQEPRWDYGIPPKGELEWFFVSSALDMVHEQGKVGLVLPLGTLFKKNNRKVMRELGWIEGIIVLPSHMFQTTSIPTCIWIFNKERSQEDKEKGIFFVNAANQAWKKDKYNTVDYNKLIEHYTNRIEEKGYSGYVSDEVLESNGDNYTIDKYIYTDEEKEVVDIVGLNLKSKDLSQKIQVQESDLNIIFDMIERIK